MNVSVRKRARQRAMLMQAELDGRGPAIATPAFIEPAQPAQLKPDLHMSDDGAVWFGVWNVRRGLAWTLDAFPCEVIAYQHALRSARREVNDHFCGPFSSEEQAESVALERLTMGRRRLGPTRRIKN
jgi:hypothetical protein